MNMRLTLDLFGSATPKLKTPTCIGARDAHQGGKQIQDCTVLAPPPPFVTPLRGCLLSR